MGQVFALLFSASYGLSNIFTSKAIDERSIDKFTGQYITLIVNSVINTMVLIVYYISVKNISVNYLGIFFFAIAGFFNSFLSRGIFYSAIPYIGVSRAGIFKITSPVFAILGGIVILGERIQTNMLIGAFVVLLGISMLTIETIHKSSISMDQKNNTLHSLSNIPNKGIVLGLLSGLVLGVGNVFRKIGINYLPSSIIGVFIGSIVALITIMIYQIIQGKGQELILTTKTINKNYLLSGIFSSLALYFVFISLKYIPVSYTNSIGASESLFTMLWSIVILKKVEIITVRTIFSAITVIAGIAILMMIE